MGKVTKESFLSNVAEHKLEVLLDNGLYRHLKVRNPKTSNQWYQITTWPDYLCISGDMGCFTFSRIEDMFQFFRDKDLGVCLQYYAEKLQAGMHYRDAEGIFKEFSIDEAKKYARELKRERITEAGRDKDAIRKIHEDFENLLKAEEEHEFYRELQDLDYDLCDLPDFYEFKYYYIWCCYAIAHAINLYDQSKQSN
ncbi:hypothetical protein [Thorsellia kenyensis]|uniref:Uncharacterized protein n=1 Tax=Thorsellia kenyensis TaxID=1549888 RepID=A0ABV6CAM5_9GAMM